MSKDLYSNYKWKYIFIGITAMWICIIFSFSLQPAEDSSQLSSGLGAWLMKHVFSGIFDTMTTEQVDFFIRKCAHFTEFFILGVLMYWTLEKWFVIHRARLGLILCMLVAAMDETIQLFVEGRSGQVTDMLLDSSGSLVGICMVLVLNKCLARRQRYVY